MVFLWKTDICNKCHLFGNINCERMHFRGSFFFQVTASQKHIITEKKTNFIYIFFLIGKDFKVYRSNISLTSLMNCRLKKNIKKLPKNFKFFGQPHKRD